jgi:hypothetical protein
VIRLARTTPVCGRRRLIAEAWLADADAYFSEP